MKAMSRFATPLSVIIWILAWELLSFFLNDKSIFPNLYQISSNVFVLVQSSEFLMTHLASSLRRLVIGVSCAIPIACLLALISVQIRPIGKLMNTFVALTFPLPKVALAPIFLLFLGIGDANKILLIGVGAFYLVFVNAYEGIQRIKVSAFADVMKIYKVRGFSYWYSFLLKGSFPQILIGVKLGLNYGLTMVVVSEYSLSNSGIGFFIWSSWDQFRILDVYSGILILSLLGLSLNSVCDLLIRHSQYQFGNS